MFPNPVDVQAYYEPMILLTLISPYSCSSAINTLCEEARGERIDSTLINEDQMLIKYRLPLSEVVTGFFDDLKRVSR
jgi:GTP-binding protein LepA